MFKQGDDLPEICPDLRADNDFFAVICSFFDYSRPWQHLKTFKRWRDCAIGTCCFNFNKEQPSNLLYRYKHFLLLIESIEKVCSSQDFSMGALTDLNAEERLLFLKQEQNLLSYYPRYLSRSEFVKPGLVFKNFFKRYTVEEQRSQLYYWLESGLSTSEINLTIVEVIDFYESMQKVIEACWLIHERVLTKNSCNSGLEDKERISGGEDAVGTYSKDAINPEILSEFKIFMDMVSPSRLSGSMRKMLVDFLMFNKCVLPLDFEDYLLDLHWLTKLLDVLDKHTIKANAV